MHGKSNVAKMTDGLTIADTVSTGLGRKFAKLLPSLTIQTQTPMASPFGLSTFPGDKGAASTVQRASLDLRCACEKTLAAFQSIARRMGPGRISEEFGEDIWEKNVPRASASGLPAMPAAQGGLCPAAPHKNDPRRRAEPHELLGRTKTEAPAAG